MAHISPMFPPDAAPGPWEPSYPPQFSLVVVLRAKSGLISPSPRRHSRKRPCRRCVKLGKPSTCINVEKKRRGRPPKNRLATVAASNPATVASTAQRPQKNLGGNWENAATQRAMRPRKQPAHPYHDDDSYGERRSSNRRRVSVRRADTEAFSPSSSSGEDDDDDDSKDDDDYRDYRSSAVAGKKRKTPLPPETATVPAVDTTSDTITKRPRAEPQEQSPAQSGTSTAHTVLPCER